MENRFATSCIHSTNHRPKRSTSLAEFATGGGVARLVQFLRQIARCYNPATMTAQEMLDTDFLQMRWRCLSLAADLDRVERAAGGAALLRDDRRVQTLRQALHV